MSTGIYFQVTKNFITIADLGICLKCFDITHANAEEKRRRKINKPHKFSHTKIHDKWLITLFFPQNWNKNLKRFSFSHSKWKQFTCYSVPIIILNYKYGENMTNNENGQNNDGNPTNSVHFSGEKEQMCQSNWRWTEKCVRFTSRMKSNYVMLSSSQINIWADNFFGALHQQSIQQRIHLIIHICLSQMRQRAIFAYRRSFPRKYNANNEWSVVRLTSVALLISANKAY